MESLAELGDELTSVLEERKETLRADGKSEKEFSKTPYPEAIEYYDGMYQAGFWHYQNLEYAEEELLEDVNHFVKRFDRKRWELFWRKVVLERYTDVSLAPVKEGEAEMTRDKFNEYRRRLFIWTCDEFPRGAGIREPSYRLRFFNDEPEDFPIERMMERRRNYELMFWESISFSAYFPKFANLDEDKRKLYNADNFFSERKRLTRSKLPLSLRSFGLFIQRLHTTPYAEEYRIPRRDFEGKWTAEPLKNEKGEARMHPIQGHRQNFMVDLSKKIWERFNGETPQVVQRSMIHDDTGKCYMQKEGEWKWTISED